ncbi:MAG: protein kinase domain-containing protein, partial [Planctomycetota bacterium]
MQDKENSHESDEARELESKDGLQEDPALTNPDDETDPDEVMHKYPAFVEKLKKLFQGMGESREDGDSVALASDIGRHVGDFKILREIGSGGMGVVFEAEQTSMRRKVALKILPPHLSFSPQAVLKFRREAEAGGRQSHPGLVSIFAVGEHEGVHFIAQELVEGGGTVADKLEKACALDELPRGYFRDCALLIAEVAEALAHAHAAGVIHRDIKPSNILLTSEAQPKVTDFGLAKVEDALALSRSGDFAGTPYYMSPEQVASRRTGIDHRTDIYSLGVTLYEMLTLVRPFEAETTQEILKKVLLDEPRDPHKRSPHVPRDLSVICLKAMEKEPGRRYQTMAEFADDLRRYLSGDVIRARPASLGVKLLKLVKRNPVVSAALGVAALTLLALMFLIPWYMVRLADEYDEVLRLSDARRLANYEEEAASLWPAFPEKIPEMKAWLDKAHALSAKVDLHRERLNSLRANALLYDDEARRMDMESHPRAPELDKLHRTKGMIEAKIASLEAEMESIEEDSTNAENQAAALESMKSALTLCEQEIADCKTAISQRRTWLFEDMESEWQHAVLQDLVRSLEEFSSGETGLVINVEERLAAAITLYDDTITNHRAAWDAAIAALADPSQCPGFEGLVLEPQIGFVPLGRDPESGLFEFAHLPSGKIPARGEDGRLVLEEDSALVFVLVPGGAFNMGARRPSDEHPEDSPNVDPQSHEYEGPVHGVRIRPFLLSKYEMTQGQWLRFTGENPSRWGPSSVLGGKRHSLLHP